MKRAARLNATWIGLLASLTMAGGQTATPAPDAPPSPAPPTNPPPALAAPTATSAPSPRLRRLNLHQNPAETLHIRRLENGLERPCGRSRPAPWRFASLVGTDAFAGELTRGSIGTIPASEETTNTQRFEAA